MKNSAALVCLMACLTQFPGNCFATPDPIVSANGTQGNSNSPVEHNNAPSAGVLTNWMRLQALSSDDLTTMLGKTNDPIESAWIHLALISKDQSTNNTQLVTALLDWRDQNPSHPANELFPASDQLGKLPAFDAPQHIAILLPEHGTYAIPAKAIHDGFMNAYNRSSDATKKQQITFYDTSGKRSLSDTINAAVTSGADFIVGPLTKNDVQILTNMHSIPIPVLALNYSKADNSNPNIYQFGLLPEDDAIQIALRARGAHLAHALIITPDTPWGKRMTTAFTAIWEQQNGTIQDSWHYSAKADFNTGIAALLGINQEKDKKLSRLKNNRDALQQQRRQDFDVIILFAQANEASIIVPLLKFYYAGNIPVYATSSIYSSKTTSDLHDLNGVIVCDTPNNSQKGNSMDNKLAAIGEDAYHLSQSIQRLALLPNFPIYRSTGALTLDNKQQVHRRMPCVAIKETNNSPSTYASNS